METKNKIIHKISVNNEKFNYLIKIQLSDDCKNGHEDFSITATFWQIGKPRNDVYFIVTDCYHDEILKVRPDLKIFTDLHLNQFTGYPMYYIQNAFFNLKNEYNSAMTKTRFMETYFVTSEQYNELLEKANTEDEFGFLLIKKFKNNLIWEDLAKKAIQKLEKLTSLKFSSTATRVYSIEKWQKLEFPEDWFEEHNVERRKKEKLLSEQNEKISAMKKNHDRKIEEMNNEFSIKKSLMQLGFLDLGNTRHYFNEREFHINVEKKVLSSVYKIENSKSSYTFTEEDYEQMHIDLPTGYRLIFNSYE